MKFKHLIDNIVTNFWFYGNFASMKNIIKKCNPIVNFSKFTSNKKMLSGVVIAIGYKLIRSQFFFFGEWICSQTLSGLNYILCNWWIKMIKDK